MKPFLALITPIGATGDEHPEHPIVLPPPGQQPPGVPTFPIWGPPGSNFPDKPGYPPVVGGGPIYPPEKPPSYPGAPTFPIWGPPGSNFPDKPGYPPTVGGGPIIPPIPPNPPVIWPGPGPLPGVDNPINKPPAPAPPGYDWYLEYLPLRGGWVWVLGPENPANQQAQHPTT